MVAETNPLIFLKLREEEDDLVEKNHSRELFQE